MGQYYLPVLCYKGKYIIYDRSIDGEYTPAKLTEHSWFYNTCCNAIAEKIYENFKRDMLCSSLAWVGDYTEDEDLKGLFALSGIPLKHSDVWYDVEAKGLTATNFSLDNKYIVNIEKREYIDCNEYKEISYDKDLEMSTHPLPLLTAVGNGRGGGDYYGINAEQVGCWAGQMIYITDNIEDAKRNSFARFRIGFTEHA